MKIRLKHILYLSFTIVTIGAYSQSPRFESFKLIKNRQNVEVNVIHQDSSGYIWIGTNYGLIKYDGIDFKLFTTEDNLYENRVSALIHDKEGILWIGHKNGQISQYKGGSIDKFDPEEGHSMEEISSFFVDNRNVIWFTTYGEGVYFYKGKNRKRLYNVSKDDGLVDNYVYSLAQDSAGLAYIATDQGISVYNPIEKVIIDTISMSDGLPDNIVKKLQFLNDDLWIGMESGVCTYNINTAEFSNILIWENYSVNNFIYLNNNDLWVSTRKKGLIRFNISNIEKIEYKIFNMNNGLPDNRTNTVFLDREKNIWIGMRRGLAINRNNNFEFLDEKDGFNIKDIYSFTLDDHGRYWVASGSGLYLVSKTIMGELEIKRLFDDPEYSYTIFISLYKDIYGNIWAGTYDFGVFKINPKNLTYKIFNTNNGLSNNNIVHITGCDSSIWFSSFGGGITKCNLSDNSSFKSFTIENGLPSNYIYSAYNDSENRTWLATDGGGAVYIKNDIIYTFDIDSFSNVNKVVYTVIEDANKSIWFNCAEKGLYKYNGTNLININESNGLKTNSIKGVSLSNSGSLLVISNDGIDLYNDHDNSFEYHGEAEGLAFWEPRENAVFKDSSGKIWIGTANGIIVYHSTDTTTKTIKPKIFITKIQVLNNEISKEINKFKYNRNQISFEYAALWYQISEPSTYRYKLEGYEDWNVETQLRIARYNKIPPGDYRFIVQVKYSGNMWMDSPESNYAFTIQPPFWKTPWFIILSIISSVVGIYTYIRIRLRNLELAKKKLEEEVRKRTHEIQKQKEEIEAQRDEIEAQRNYVIKQRDQIEKQNENITSSIQYASRIQNAVLPPDEAFDELLGDHFIFFVPKDIVSGDFYYLNAVDENIVVAAADCTGHGVPGAFMSMLGITLINKIIAQHANEISAGKILTVLRDEIKKSLRQTGKEGEAKDGMDMALCVINKTEKIISFAGAYNPLLLIRNKEIINFKADRMPIGIYIKEKESFTNNTIEIQKDDMFYMYSDGFQDQIGGEEKKKFMVKPFKDLLIEISDKPVTKQKEILDYTFKNWKGTDAQIDDVLVLGFRV